MRRTTALRELFSQVGRAVSSPQSTNSACCGILTATATPSFATTSELLKFCATSIARTTPRRYSSTTRAKHHFFSSSNATTAATSSTSPGVATATSWKEVQHLLKRQINIILPSYEAALGTGYNARVAIVNALYSAEKSTHWGRLVSILLAEAATRGDPLAWCYNLPVTSKEVAQLVAAEEADRAAIAAASKGIFRTILKYLASWLRLMWLLFLFAPAVVSAPVAMRHDMRRREWLRLLRRTLERAGPAFIKWGQWAATRADLFPPDFCSELEHLHTQAPAHDFPYTETALKAAFGFEVDDLFTDFETVPVASGSIGQIHRAKLTGAGARLTNMAEGSVVAVKVRHPGVSESIERDFALMVAAAKVAEFIPALKALRLEESLKQFAAPLREQVDLGREGFYLHTFNFNFRKEGNVSFPVPLYPLVAPSVLTETFENGDHISMYVARGAGAPFNSELAKAGARTLLHMLVVDAFAHSDLHPGNILVRIEPPGGAFGAAIFKKLDSFAAATSRVTGIDVQPALQSILRPSIVLLDAGMATRLSPEDQINMVGLFDAFSRLEARSVANWTLRFAGEEQTCPDPEAFREDLEGHFSRMKDADAFQKGDTSDGAKALAAVLETVRQHQVNLPGHICAVVVTTLVLEGWSHALDPAHSSLTEVKRIISLKKGETRLRKAAMWVMGAAVERQILEHVPQFALEGNPEDGQQQQQQLGGGGGKGGDGAVVKKK